VRGFPAGSLFLSLSLSPAGVRGCQISLPLSLSLSPAGVCGLTDFRPNLISSLFLCRRLVYIVVDLLCVMLFSVVFVYCCRSALLLLF
jgi:hypothetical protein